VAPVVGGEDQEGVPLLVAGIHRSTGVEEALERLTIPLSRCPDGSTARLGLVVERDGHGRAVPQPT